jgi:5-methylcytosine-specific restriction endonuclease McrA
MPKDTPSMAKNKIKRALGAILDPHPTENEKAMVWEYFENTCAYCGLVMERKSRAGHLDHVVSTADGGNNSIHNHVLSCWKCNGDEKREMEWVQFLKQKNIDIQSYELRKEKIENWLAKNENKKPTETRAEAERIIEEALSQFDESVRKMRNLRENYLTNKDRL